MQIRYNLLGTWQNRPNIIKPIKFILNIELFMIIWKLNYLYHKAYNKTKPCSSCLLPLFQNESSCETIQMKMSSICLEMNMQVRLIFMWKVLYQDSFWNRSKRNSEMAYW